MALLMVRPVSIMSSTMITVRPVTDPDKLIFLCVLVMVTAKFVILLSILEVLSSAVTLASLSSTK